MAIIPHPPQLPGAPSDKIQHIMAFLVLGALGILRLSAHQPCLSRRRAFAVRRAHRIGAVHPGARTATATRSTGSRTRRGCRSDADLSFTGCEPGGAAAAAGQQLKMLVHARDLRQSSADRAIAGLGKCGNFEWLSAGYCACCWRAAKRLRRPPPKVAAPVAPAAAVSLDSRQRREGPQGDDRHFRPRLARAGRLRLGRDRPDGRRFRRSSSIC